MKSVLLTAFLLAAALFGAGAPHAPIVITSDADFTPENGVVGGSGTPEDPYLIQGWEIDAANGTGITVRGTSVSFLIRACHISGGPRGTGVTLSQTQGGAIESCIFFGLGAGVFVYRSPGVGVQSTSFVGTRRGIDGSESPRLGVRGSSFIKVKKEGVFMWHCHDSLLEGNLFREALTAVYLDSCHRVRLVGNRVEGAEQGIFLWDCFDCVITKNVFSSCVLGVALVHTSARNAVWHNAFLGCVRPAACDGPGNLWDGGYPTGGNYWEAALEDRFSGLEQDRPGGDGIGDAPFEVPLGCLDRYPLAAPPQGLLKEGGSP
ncbi:MAG: hypothetical protein XD60_1265 [Acetothermia bacterium 64_32]|nr:MAG: hypothetical protein XD60_1265 [Acetothermia bacterium 64_32]